MLIKGYSLQEETVFEIENLQFYGIGLNVLGVITIVIQGKSSK